MNVSLVVADDFYPEPMKLREAVLNSEFKTETGPDGLAYTGISRYEEKALYPLVSELMRCSIQPTMPVWRLSYAGELPSTVVHADDICSQWAGLLYLNTPEQCAANYSGTGFFKHRSLGIEHMPSDLALTNAGIPVAPFKESMEADWKSESPWELTGFTGMKFNRFVAYPTSKFHSRYPHEAFGTTKDNARLIWACFFNLVP